MSIQSMNGVLEQIKFQAQQISTTGNNNTLKPELKNDDSVSFSSLLSSISNMQNTAKSQAQSYMLGASDIGLNDVMVSMQKSSVALNFGIQARNKIVSAYQEIMNMGV